VSSFDERAAQWDKNRRRQEVARAVAEFIKPYLRGGEGVLDFGCGTGLVSYNLLPLPKKIVGVDSSAKMREVFNNKSPDPTTIYALPEIPDEEFDLIVTSMTLHHIEDIETLAGLFRSHLTPGGLLAIADLLPEDGTFHDHGNEGVFHFGFNPSELTRTFGKEGFRQIALSSPYTIRKERGNYPLFTLILQRERNPHSK